MTVKSFPIIVLMLFVAFGSTSNGSNNTQTYVNISNIDFKYETQESLNKILEKGIELYKVFLESVNGSLDSHLVARKNLETFSEDKIFPNLKQIELEICREEIYSTTDLFSEFASISGGSASELLGESITRVFICSELFRKKIKSSDSYESTCRTILFGLENLEFIGEITFLEKNEYLKLLKD